LDSIGLTIIIKMMAGIKAESDQERGFFDELEEVFNMSEQLYQDQSIVKNEKQFIVTIQAFVQCSNSLVADMEQPQSDKKLSLGKSPSERYYKMISYLLEKLNIVILQNPQYIYGEWNFLTGFWMSFCSNKNSEIQLCTISYVGEIVHKLLETRTHQS
jgi:hypothetical protein